MLLLKTSSVISFNSVLINITIDFVKNLFPSSSLDSNFSDGLNYRRIVMCVIN
jgi:hypothetical protein